MGPCLAERAVRLQTNCRFWNQSRLSSAAPVDATRDVPLLIYDTRRPQANRRGNTTPATLYRGVRQVYGGSGIPCVPLLCEQCGLGDTSENTLLTEQWHTAARIAIILAHTSVLRPGLLVRGTATD